MLLYVSLILANLFERKYFFIINKEHPSLRHTDWNIFIPPWLYITTARQIRDVTAIEHPDKAILESFGSQFSCLININGMAWKIFFHLIDILIFLIYSGSKLGSIQLIRN